nr:MAG TPA: hypothetical protein [Caudoviricetes sp.]
MCTAKRVSKVLARMGYRTTYDSIRDYISLIWDNNEIVVQCLYGWYTVRYIDVLPADERDRLHIILKSIFIYVET